MKHIHKYLKKNIGRTKLNPFFVYQCTLPNCTHYLREEFIFGKMSICWDCNKEFLIVLRGTQPMKKKHICDNCWNEKYGKVTDNKKIEELLKAAGAI